jgi:hypothetical protein
MPFHFHFHTSPGIKFKFTPNFPGFHFHFSFPRRHFLSQILPLSLSLPRCFLGTIGGRNGSFELALFNIFFVGVSLSLRSMSEWILFSMPLDLWLIFDSGTDSRWVLHFVIFGFRIFLRFCLLRNNVLESDWLRVALPFLVQVVVCDWVCCLILSWISFLAVWLPRKWRKRKWEATWFTAFVFLLSRNSTIKSLL